MYIKKIFYLFGLWAVLALWLFCGDAVKPEDLEGNPPKLSNNKRIYLSGTPLLNNNFFMFVKVSGTSPLSYQWYKNGNTLTGQIADTLTFTTLTYSDSGRYHCIVSNDFGMDISLVETLTVVNQPPDWATDTMYIAIAADSCCTLSLADSCQDPNHDSIVFSLAQGLPTGDTLINGTYIYSASGDTAGVYCVTVQASDGILSTPLCIILTLQQPNRPPVFCDSLPLTRYTVTENASLTIPFKAADPDGDSVTYILSNCTLPNDVDTASLEDTLLTWFASYDDSGTYTLSICATDGMDTSCAEVTVTVENVNRAPVFIDSLTDDAYYIAEDSLLVILFKAVDPDGDPITYHISKCELPKPYTFTGQQLIWQSGFDNSGYYEVEILARDHSDTARAPIQVFVGDVNRPPVITIGSYKDGDTCQITELSTLAFTVTVTDLDTADIPVLLSAIHTPSGAAYDTANGAFSYTPQLTVVTVSHDTLFSDITFYATDNKDTMYLDSFVLNIMVNDSDLIPVCVNDNAQTSEDTAVTIDALANDSDPEEDSIYIASVTGGELGTAVISDGKILYTPLPDSFGTDNISYQIADTAQNTAAGSIQIVIRSVNDRPSFVPGDTIEVNQNDGTVSVPWAQAIKTGPPNESNQAATFIVTKNNVPDGIFSAGPVMDANGIVTFSLTGPGWGDAVFDVVCEDNGGTANGGVDVTDMVPLYIRVNKVNHKPVITEGPVSGVELETDAYYEASLKFQDPDNDPCTVTFHPALHGLVYDSATEKIKWHIDREFFNMNHEPCTLTVTVDDGYENGDTSHTWVVTLIPHTWQYVSDIDSSYCIAAKNKDTIYVMCGIGTVRISIDGGTTLNFNAPVYIYDQGSMADLGIFSDKYLYLFGTGPLGNTVIVNIWDVSINPPTCIDNRATPLYLYHCIGAAVNKSDNRWYFIDDDGKVANKAIGETTESSDSLLDHPLVYVATAKQKPVSFILGNQSLYRCNRDISLSWDQLPIPFSTFNNFKLSVAGLTGDTVYIVGEADSKIRCSYDALAATPEISYIPLQFVPMNIAMINGNTGWVVSNIGEIYFTNDCFATLVKEPVADGGLVSEIIIADNNDAVFVRCGSKFYRY